MTLAIAVVAVAVLYLAKVVVLPLALAILFAFLVAPIVKWLERIKVPRTPAIVLVILTVVVLVCAIGWGVATQLLQITNHLPAYRANITAKIAEFHNPKGTSFSHAAAEVERLGREVGLSHPSSSGAKPFSSSAERPVLVKEVSSPEGSTLSNLHGILRVLVETLLVVVFTFFLLLQREDLRNRLIRLTGRGELNLKTQAMDEASNRISRYFILLLTVNVSYGIVIFIALHFIGLPHAWLFGALTTLLRFIPYIGAPIAGLLPITLSLAVFPGWEQALIIFGIFLCVEIVTANYIEPRLYGGHTGVSPLAILVAAVFWTLIWGPIGLILSVPLTVCVVVVGGHVPTLKFLTVLLGDQPAMQPSAQYYQRLLADDEREASHVLDAYLKEKPLTELYDSVLIPALSLAEEDRHQNDLDEATASFIHQTTKELVEELGFRPDNRGRESPVLTEIPDGDRGNPELPISSRRAYCAFRFAMKPMKLSHSCWLSCWKGPDIMRGRSRCVLEMKWWPKFCEQNPIWSACQRCPLSLCPMPGPTTEGCAVRTPNLKS